MSIAAPITMIITTIPSISTIIAHFFTPYTVYEKTLQTSSKKQKIHPQTQMYPNFYIPDTL